MTKLCHLRRDPAETSSNLSSFSLQHYYYSNIIDAADFVKDTRSRFLILHVRERLGYQQSGMTVTCELITSALPFNPRASA